ncbi:MAG TPA: SDR family oxidoreductase [Kribbella sp.]|uniref:SDR family NAD(P)-dependent oxidoreductase n=1 Tax=Kribbella sp. TaxID=1871183 RepID=UPI002D77EF4E|nr:SDR family oxidoreductase [Kribbella sp.]HET6294368.1 SDR family oxidoreductase [Kribbella sp.]
MQLSGKNAVITGATSGIGRATALALAALGAQVLITGRDQTRGKELLEEVLAAGGAGQFLPADLTDATSAREFAGRALEAGDGRIDILVNNLGIGSFGTTQSTTEEAFDQMYSVNVKVPYFLVAEIAPTMAERGDGAIVNVTTTVSGFGQAGAALYGSSKAAVALLTKAWAAEFGPSGVRVNTVSPGPTRTPGTDFMGDSLDQAAAVAPARRVAAPKEIADVVAFLCTDAASFVHGATLPADGGRSAV